MGGKEQEQSTQIPREITVLSAAIAKTKGLLSQDRANRELWLLLDLLRERSRVVQYEDILAKLEEVPLGSRKMQRLRREASFLLRAIDPDWRLKYLHGELPILDPHCSSQRRETSRV